MAYCFIAIVIAFAIAIAIAGLTVTVSLLGYVYHTATFVAIAYGSARQTVYCYFIMAATLILLTLLIVTG
jgi:hypothetical protein